MPSAAKASIDSSHGWDANDLLEPELLLASQIETSDRARSSGELALLWTVFIDGIRTYCMGAARERSDTLAVREAEWWIFRPDSDALTSFGILCAIFGFDPRRLRRGLRRFRAEPDPAITRLLEHVSGAPAKIVQVRQNLRTDANFISEHGSSATVQSEVSDSAKSLNPR